MILESTPALAISGFFTIALGLIILITAYRQAKRKRFKQHRNLMITAFAVNAAFLVQYVIRFLTEGETQFKGPIIIHDFVYLPILIIHISGALFSIGMISFHLLSSFKHEQKSSSNSPFFEKPYRLRHRSFGRITFYVWFSSFVGGIIIFLMLYILF